MKRSYEDSTRSASSSAKGSPPACEPSPPYSRKRRSTSPSTPTQLQNTFTSAPQLPYIDHVRSISTHAVPGHTTVRPCHSCGSNPNHHSQVPAAAVSSIFADASRVGRIPTISRKVRACAACKKQKIRCDFEDGEPTCVRCKKMKLDCVVNRSLQTILDEDVEFVALSSKKFSHPPLIDMHIMTFGATLIDMHIMSFGAPLIDVHIMPFGATLIDVHIVSFGANRIVKVEA